MLPADDPRERIEGNLAALPIAGKIQTMDAAASEATVDDMVASLEPWITDGVLTAPSATGLLLAYS